MSLTERLLSAPTPDEPLPTRPSAPSGWAPGSHQWDGEAGTLVTRGLEERPKQWDEFIRDAGLDPDEVEAVEPIQVRGWDAAVGEGKTQRMRYYKLTLRRRGHGINLAGIVDWIRGHQAPAVRLSGPEAFIHATGDMQLGKADGDGVEGTVDRCVASIDAAAARFKELAARGRRLGWLHSAWLGDHIEGFLSQGGANVARTPATLSDQIELATELMLYAARQFAPLAEKVTFVAVPGNHGETTRFAGKGVTRYDDSFDTLAMKNVRRVLAENSAAYGHVDVWTPAHDELTVTVDIAGTVITHAHGHQWRPGKHFDWWKGQAFGERSAGAADILLAGHLHHALIDTSSKRTFMQVPANEGESTWWRHLRGEVGEPGHLTFVTNAGRWSDLEVL